VQPVWLSPIAARSLGEFQEASEAPVSVAILAE
jgi:hypothetical protein